MKRIRERFCTSFRRAVWKPVLMGLLVGQALTTASAQATDQTANAILPYNAPVLPDDTSQSSVEDVDRWFPDIEIAIRNRDWIRLIKLTQLMEEMAQTRNLLQDRDAAFKANFAGNLAVWRGDGYRETGQFAKAVPAYETAVAAYEQGQTKQSASYISALGRLALVLRELGQNERAYTYFVESQRLGEVVFGEQTIDNATAIANVALILERMGRYEEAAQYFSKAVPLYEAIAGPQHPFTGLAYNNWALNHYSLGQYPEAEKLFRKALSVLTNGSLPENHEYIASALGGLAVTINDQGRPQEAEPLARQSIATWNAAKGSDHPETNLAVANLATILLAQNRAEEAEQYFVRVLDRNRAQFGDAHIWSARHSSNLAIAKTRQGKYLSAAPDMRNAVAWAGAALGEDHADLGLYYSNLATTLSNLKEFPEAIVAARKAIAITEKAIGPDHPRMVQAYGNLGLLQLLGGEAKLAEQSMRTALKKARALPGRAGYPLLLALNGLTLVIAPDNPRSNEALALSREALRIIETNRSLQRTTSNGATGSLPINEDFRPGELDEASFGFHMKILATRAAAIPVEEDTLMREMFITAQNASLSASAKAMSQTAARTASGDSALAKLVRRQQDLKRQQVQLDRQFETALVTGKQNDTTRYQNEIDQVTSELTVINAKLGTEFPQYAELVRPGALDISDVQQRLGDSDGLLLVFPSIGDIFLLGVTKDSVSWKRQSRKQESAETSIRYLRCQLDPLGCPEDFFADEQVSDAQLEGYRAYDRTRAYSLYQDIFAPVEDIFLDKKHIFVVSSGAFASLPLAALINEQPQEGDNANPDVLSASSWLGEKYAFTQLPAVSALKLQDKSLLQSGGKPASTDWGFIGFGAPTLDGPAQTASTKRGAGSSGFFRAANSQGLSLADPQSLKQLVPLPGTRRELDAMAAALNAGDLSVVTGDNATETAVRTDQKMAGSEVIIFATHGLLPGELDGLDEPALVFTPPETATIEDDGVLSASEATELKLNARWVILSACNTASAEGQGGGDSLSGLSRAFLFAGAKSLLASNWRVGDEETALLTVETIKADRAAPDAGRALALQQAMHAVRTGKRGDGSPIADWRPEWAHPASWAPFIHISNSR
ncbi:CHAT domain-containing tetratricopeptide repeat protein [Parasphingorhabdus halotolerans]|uniref:CHAT domain-containing protein n=1 Tax=Parasphingorhabdus halotolerans TaxID=2725558 RepID=A0A6H2DN05_9SPHN|nr:CHAT domain-containing tetratricopeptide repeat protein [Parasphingorhabdus halotolerans]QJB70049.1 CHAT domain-containing protein [Parasphingorhabdus halotolerans]